MTDSNLIIELRKMIEDNDTVKVFTTAELYGYLNKHRTHIYDNECEAEDEDYLVYYAGFKNLDNVVLKQSDGTVITSTDYTIEEISGVITFTTAQSGVYLFANSYDLLKTASEIWLIRASRATFSGDIQLSDETMPKDKNNYDYCMKKSQDLMPSSLNLRMRRG